MSKNTNITGQESTNTAKNSRWVEVGSLWEREDGFSGTLSFGILGECRIVIKKNGFKTKDGQPDYKIITRLEDLMLVPGRAPSEKKTEDTHDTEEDVPF